MRQNLYFLSLCGMFCDFGCLSHAVVWTWQFGGALTPDVSPSAETCLSFSSSLDWGYGFGRKVKQDSITLNRGYAIKMIYHLRCWPWSCSWASAYQGFPLKFSFFSSTHCTLWKHNMPYNIFARCLVFQSTSLKVE